MISKNQDKNQVRSELLSEAQKKAVSHNKGPLLITAGAGSGKTRTLTSRLRHLIEEGTPPSKIIAITFTNKAAREMMERLKDVVSEKDRPFIGTFHSLGARILRQEARLMGRTRGFTIFDDNDSLKVIKQICADLNISKAQHSPSALQYTFSKIKNEGFDPSDVFAKEKPIHAFKEYESSLKRQNAFDFDDLITKVVEVMDNNPKVLKKYQEKFIHILVDEYQDINASQYDFIKLLSGGHNNLSVVGDDNQAIYSFRGADFRNFLNFEKDWPDAKIVSLGENYRSTKTIVDAAAAVIKNNKLQRPKKIFTRNGDGSAIQVLETHNPTDEAEAVIGTIYKNNKLSDVAILYRTNAQSRAIEQSLQVGGIPYEIFGGLRFYERKKIKDIMACLNYASNPRDEVSQDRISKNFRKKISETMKADLPSLAKELAPLEIIGYVIKTSDYFGELKKKHKNADERKENVQELMSFAANFKNLSDFLEKTSLFQDSETLKEQAKTVKLMTIHTAKGLEFEDIYLVGCSETLLPHQKSLSTEDELEEERRLMYVAMTRAKKNLHISFYYLPSRFLYEIPPELVEFKSRKSSFGKDWWEKDEDEINLI